MQLSLGGTRGPEMHLVRQDDRGAFASEGGSKGREPCEARLAGLNPGPVVHPHGTERSHSHLPIDERFRDATGEVALGQGYTQPPACIVLPSIIHRAAAW